MTQEEKMLLIKDLSARLPYAVTVEHTSGFRGTLHDLTTLHLYDGDDIEDIDCGIHFFGDDDWFSVEYFKPYLFPLSSMTEEQKYDFYCRFIENDCDFDDFKEFYFVSCHFLHSPFVLKRTYVLISVYLIISELSNKFRQLFF